MIAVLAVASATPIATARPASAGPAHPLAHPFLVGAARVDITPPTFSSRDSAAAFPNCPAAVFNGPRRFDLEEPYTDTNRDGRYTFGEPFCDANGNTRWDGLWDSGGVNMPVTSVHDRIYARAFAVGDGTHTVVVVSVTAQGLFNNDIAVMRRLTQQRQPRITALVVSANHNESSPDTIGIYGTPSVGGDFGARSGQDAYYLSFLEHRVATAAVRAYDAMRPGELKAATTRLPHTVTINLSNNFPTTNDKGQGVALDPQLRILQGVTATGKTVFTVVNLAAHNQEIGHGPNHGALSEDWPGYLQRRIDAREGGVSIFLVADNGSIEDPITTPTVGTGDGSFAQARASGRAIAGAAIAALPDAHRLRPGPVRFSSRSLDVPLQNNLFVAAAAAGLFGDRTGYVATTPTGPLALNLRTEAGLVDLGPQVQMLVWPGEAFPALAVGSPWGADQAPCAGRPNPPVPTWLEHATYRFQIGLGDDMLGYLLPAWGWASEPGVAPTTCVTDENTDKDSKGHQHKLEDESVGYSAGSIIAAELTALVKADHPDPAARIRTGRYIRADGTASRNPQGAVAVRFADGELIAIRGVRSFGHVKPTLHGRLITYTGRTQAAAGTLSTRGIEVRARNGKVRRYYVDVFPDITEHSLPPATRG
jgi:hypothetical protein